MKATYLVGSVQALAWTARDKFQINSYFVHFLVYSHFVLYRLSQSLNN
jgi:hypothetical protein